MILHPKDQLRHSFHCTTEALIDKKVVDESQKVNSTHQCIKIFIHSLATRTTIWWCFYKSLNHAYIYHTVKPGQIS